MSRHGEARQRALLLSPRTSPGCAGPSDNACVLPRFATPSCVFSIMAPTLRCVLWRCSRTTVQAALACSGRHLPAGTLFNAPMTQAAPTPTNHCTVRHPPSCPRLREAPALRPTKDYPLCHPDAQRFRAKGRQASLQDCSARFNNREGGTASGVVDIPTSSPIGSAASARIERADRRSKACLARCTAKATASTHGRAARGLWSSHAHPQSVVSSVS